MYPTPRTLAIITLSTVAALLPACTSTHPSTPKHTHAIADEHCPLRARLDEHGSLTKAQLVSMLHTSEGREQLARFADKYDTVFYDGEHRYAQIDKVASFSTGTTVPVLTCYFAWQHPDYTVPRTIMFTENATADAFDITFVT